LELAADTRSTLINAARDLFSNLALKRGTPAISRGIIFSLHGAHRSTVGRLGIDEFLVFVRVKAIKVVFVEMHVIHRIKVGYTTGAALLAVVVVRVYH
jgi:hypothetical protein